MQLAVNILVLAATYGLISVGYVLVYRVSRVLNLAHGELMMLAAYLLMATAQFFGGSPLLAIPVALVLSATVGLLVYVLMMRRMAGEAVFAAVLVTIALGILVRGVVILVWTAQLQHPIKDLHLENRPLHLGGGAAISTMGAATIAAAVVVYLALFLFFRFSRWGIRMRAVGENPLLAAQRGIELHGVLALAWAMATLTGGIAGMLMALDSGLEETMIVVGLKAFPVAMVGGLDSVKGTVVGALTVAGAEVAAIHFIDPLLSEVVPFLVLLAMLIVRPWGLFGTHEELERV